MSRQKLKTQLTSPQASPGFLLWQVTNKWQAKQRRALAELDLTHVQFVLLASLVWFANESSVTQRRLADLTRIDIMMTSQVVRKLEQKGLLTRIANKQDSRSFVLSPTSTGIALANRAVKIVEAVDRDFFAPLENYTSHFIASMHALAGRD
jgi:DNA-binding MarR family transcriptional regulator